MCQIVVINNMSKIKGQDKLTSIVARYLSDQQKDGFGYAIQGVNGTFGERTLSPKGFKVSFSQPILDVPYVNSSYNRWGIKSKATGSGIFHGRTSTNDRTLLNTHPIVKHNWTLIHNGVVSNHGPKYNMITTNDTEHVLEHLATTGISGIESHLSGYYAVAAFDPKGLLHIFRDSIAPLYVAVITSINTKIFATSKNLIESICNDMNWKHSIISPMTDNTYLIFDKNNLISHTNINPKGSSSNESRYAELSLGHSMDGPSDNVLDFFATRKDRRYTADELEFLREVVEYADASYVIKDYRNNNISVEEFRMLEPDEQLYCTVIRGDGTVVDPEDYFTEKLYDGSGY